MKRIIRLANKLKDYKISMSSIATWDAGLDKANTLINQAIEVLYNLMMDENLSTDSSNVYYLQHIMDKLEEVSKDLELES